MFTNRELLKTTGGWKETLRSHPSPPNDPKLERDSGSLSHHSVDDGGVWISQGFGKKKTHDTSMGRRVCLPRLTVEFYGESVGKYTVRPIMGTEDPRVLTVRCMVLGSPVTWDPNDLTGKGRWVSGSIFPPKVCNAELVGHITSPNSRSWRCFSTRKRIC